MNKVREKLSAPLALDMGHALWRPTRKARSRHNDGAQTRLRGSGALINPYYHAKENGPERIRNPEAFHSQCQLQTVAFDIAITASKSGKAGGGFGVAVIVASLKADGHRETSDSSTSRVRFEVVVDLPHQKPEQP